METRTIEISGRKYEVMFSPDIPEGAYVVIGPPEGLVDGMGLPDPFATRLHNILFERRIFTYKDISSGRIAIGVLQEALTVDSQLLAQAFFNYEKEST